MFLQTRIRFAEVVMLRLNSVKTRASKTMRCAPADICFNILLRPSSCHVPVIVGDPNHEILARARARARLRRYWIARCGAASAKKSSAALPADICISMCILGFTGMSRSAHTRTITTTLARKASEPRRKRIYIYSSRLTR